jgi:hypothetical protein
MLQDSELVDPNLLVVKDADAVTTNQYSVRLLGDISNALSMTYNILPIEHHTRPDQVPSTGIFPSKYRALVRAPPSFRISFHISFHLINVREHPPRNFVISSSRVFSRDRRQQNAAAEITVSRSPPGHG